MHKIVSEDGCAFSQKSNVWKLHVLAGGVAGSIDEQNRVEIPDMKIPNPNPLFEHALEERCHEFGKRVRRFCRKLKMDVANVEDVRQLVRASGSVGANYIEANENVGSGWRLKVQNENKQKGS